MPVFGLGEEGVDPNPAFSQRFLVGLGVAVTPHPFEVLLLEAAPESASLGALRAAGGAFRTESDVPTLESDVPTLS